jgi:hypothetical protein
MPARRRSWQTTLEMLALLDLLCRYDAGDMMADESAIEQEQVVSDSVGVPTSPTS